MHCFQLLIRCKSASLLHIRCVCVSDFSLVSGRMSIPELADRTLEWRTDLAHSGPRQILHVSSAKRLLARCSAERDFVKLRERVHGLTIRARTGWSGREDPLQQHKAVERRADHDDDDVGSTLHCRLVRSSFHLIYTTLFLYNMIIVEEWFTF